MVIAPTHTHTQLLCRTRSKRARVQVSPASPACLPYAPSIPLLAEQHTTTTTTTFLSTGRLLLPLSVMHGVPRQRPGEAAAHETPAQSSKNALLRLLLDEVLENHRSRCYTQKALQQNARLLELNPEVYTAWNYRKLAVKDLMDKEEEESGRKSLVDEELRVVERALKTNYKSYGAWHHRKWVIVLGLSSLDHEFSLLSQLLKLDARNFHGWNYRRFAVKVKGVTAQEEIDYTTRKIKENFSNYSAWHNRSALLSHLFNDKLREKKTNTLEEEYELVKNAFWTEPDDQSAWFYQSWLLAQTLSSTGPKIIGVWPHPGSSLAAEFQPHKSTWEIRYSCPVDVTTSMTSQSLPIVVCFSEPVHGLSNETVTVEGFGGHSIEAAWSPKSTTIGTFSRIWAAELPLPRAFCGASENAAADFQVQVKMVVQSGIASQTAGPFQGPFSSNFSLKLGNVPPGIDTLRRGVKSPDLNDLAIEDAIQGDTVERPPENTLDVGEGNKAYDKWRQRVISKEIDSCRQLLELEKYSKWAKLTLARFLTAQDSRAAGHFAHQYGEHTNEVMELYKELAVLDPDHAAFYWDQHSLLHRIAQDKSCTAKADGHWFQLDKLSLTKFTRGESLLWVQRLDLSNNKLRSVDGIEALQLLVSLNMSRNLIPTVMALAPLHLIHRLKFLDVSHNEIGGHTAYPCRYLCPSLLSHPSDSIDVDGAESWEISCVFGRMQLTELKIAGNPSSQDEKHRQALIRALPSLQLLDNVDVISHMQL